MLFRSQYNTSGAFRTTQFAYMYAFGFACPPLGSTGGCSAFTTDKAQFGLDNLSLNVIPEPASLGLVAAALTALGAARRRRQA